MIRYDPERISAILVPFTGLHFSFHSVPLPSGDLGVPIFWRGDFFMEREAAALNANACSSSFLRACSLSDISFILGRKAGLCRQHSLMMEASGPGTPRGNGGRLLSSPTAMTICMRLLHSSHG